MSWSFSFKSSVPSSSARQELGRMTGHEQSGRMMSSPRVGATSASRIAVRQCRGISTKSGGAQAAAVGKTFRRLYGCENLNCSAGDLDAGPRRSDVCTGLWRGWTGFTLDRVPVLGFESSCTDPVARRVVRSPGSDPLWRAGSAGCNGAIRSGCRSTGFRRRSCSSSRIHGPSTARPPGQFLAPVSLAPTAGRS
jgi:hypothetical protein